MTLRSTPYDPEAGELLQSVLDGFARFPLTAWITFDVRDVVANTLGATVGLTVMLLSERARRARASPAS